MADDIDWALVEQVLMTRSGGRCEIQSPECLGGKWGDLSALARGRRSIHHRRPRGMGGTKRLDVHTLAGLVNTCGHGTIGCHRYVEINRGWAERRGLLVAKEGLLSDPRLVPLVLPSGRRVLLDEHGPWYNDAPGAAYDLHD